MSQDDAEHHLPTLQAPVKALDPHGVTIVSLGTVMFAIGTMICWWQLPALQGLGKGWWMATAVLGTVIGMLALTVLLLRRWRRLR